MTVPFCAREKRAVTINHDGLKVGIWRHYPQGRGVQ
jgi:hypothetical protein